MLTTSDNTFASLAAKMPDAVHELGTDTKSWARKAGMDWEIKESELAYTTDGGVSGKLFKGKRVFYRSDTGAPLAVVGSRFHALQPKQVLGFYEEVAERYGFKLAVAGTMFGGTKLWAMAETPHLMALGDKADQVKGALFLVTACDGSTSTSAFFTSFRVWCANQLPVIDSHARRGAGRGKVFRLSHSTAFTTERVERDLDLLNTSWKGFEDMSRRLANKSITRDQAIAFLKPFYYKGQEEVLTQDDVAELRGAQTLRKVLDVYENGEGQANITGTAWGLVNAVTRYMDHEQRAKSSSLRINKAWLHGGREKAEVFNAAVSLLEAAQVVSPKKGK